MPANEEIYEALATIKKICQLTECPCCPLHRPDNPDACQVSHEYDPPCDWHINKPNQWQAF